METFRADPDVQDFLKRATTVTGCTKKYFIQGALREAGERLIEAALDLQRRNRESYISAKPQGGSASGTR